jgi:hypothetical protein
MSVVLEEADTISSLLLSLVSLQIAMAEKERSRTKRRDVGYLVFIMFILVLELNTSGSFREATMPTSRC